MKNLSKKHIKWVKKMAEEIDTKHAYPKLCYDCSFHDCDCGCTAGQDVWYWCPYECFNLENYIEEHKMYSCFKSEKIDKRYGKRWRKKKRKEQHEKDKSST